MAMSEVAPLTKWLPLALIASFVRLVRSILAACGCMLYAVSDTVGSEFVDVGREEYFGRASCLYMKRR